eukprot:7388605-Prymnesium_polylepis.1
MVKLHYDWKYPFLPPTIQEVCDRYKMKFHGVDPQVAAAVETAIAGAANTNPALSPHCAASPTDEGGGEGEGGD